MIRYTLEIKRIFYIFFCTIYRKIFYLYYIIYFKNIKNFISRNNSYYKYQKESLISELIDLDRVSKTLKSKYQEIFILEEDYIDQIIKNLFNKNFKNFISEKTGIKYSVDYILLYKNKFIEEIAQDNSIYANKMHIDKSFSPFTIKVFIPINIFTNKNGPLEVKVKNSKSFSNFSYNPKDFTKFFTDKKITNIFLFNPSQSYHRAGIPQKNHSSINMLLQLNPSKYWSRSTNLYFKQFNIEPNFPEIRNINQDRIGI